MWTISRFITGISLVSCYVVTESWLNDRATNKNRGQLLSAYMMVIYFGLAVGMLLLNVSKPDDYEPFILVSILLSIALVPILLTKRPAPKFKKIETISRFITGISLVSCYVVTESWLNDRATNKNRGQLLLSLIHI